MRTTKSGRADAIQRFEARERTRAQMRFYELSTMAALYAKERCVKIDDAYKELVKALDNSGFLGARVLYLHPDVSPPYFREGPDLNLDPKKPPPPYLPHKTSPLIIRQFIEAREKEMGWDITRDVYLARCWIPAKQAAQWLQSKGIEPPRAIGRRAALTRRVVNTRKAPMSQKRLRAQTAIAEIWPSGVPKPEAVSDKELVSKVSQHLEKKGLQAVHRDTVLRAARRRLS
jgi:hypothetical protein